MKRLFVVGLVTMGAIALASGAPVGAADEPAVNEKPARVGPNFVDVDKDGACDNCGAAGPGKGPAAAGRASGARDGSGRQVGTRGGSGRQVGPRDGTGRGQGSPGRCDGTGPRGGRQGRRGGGRR
jgi:hypothetical protein